MPELPTLWVDEYGEMEIVKLRPVRWCLTHDSAGVDDGSMEWCHEAVFEDWIHSERNGTKPKPCEIVEGGLWLPKEQT